jgi:hypothetical protein
MVIPKINSEARGLSGVGKVAVISSKCKVVSEVNGSTER